MSNTYKINIYFKNKEKPLILTDNITKENPYMNTIEYFKGVMTGDNKIITIDFANDYAIFNAKDVDYVTISKPHLDEKDDITLLDDTNDKVDIKELTIDTPDDTNEEIPEDDEVFNNDSDDITVVED